MKYISRTVWILSIISLLTDVASEMLYPIMPVFLQSIGFSVVLIGVLEGIAEATAGICKGYFGKLSDNSGKRAPFIQWGYILSALTKPMMVFGLHRGMDTLGAVLGPVFALVFLYYRPSDYKTLFLIAFLPGVAAVLTTLFLKDKKQNQHLVAKIPTPFFSFLGYWKESPLLYRKVVVGLLVFALFNSSDMLLLLRVKQSGLNDTHVIGLYIFYNLIYAIASLPFGMIADKFSLKKVFTFGLVLFAAVYLGMALSTNIYVYLMLFFLYGLYAAATEGISKAWISNITDKKDTATAIGSFAGFQSIAAMIASSLAGAIWFWLGVETAFILTSAITVLVIIYFIVVIPTPKTISGSK